MYIHTCIYIHVIIVNISLVPFCYAFLLCTYLYHQIFALMLLYRIISSCQPTIILLYTQSSEILFRAINDEYFCTSSIFFVLKANDVRACTFQPARYIYFYCIDIFSIIIRSRTARTFFFFIATA